MLYAVSSYSAKAEGRRPQQTEEQISQLQSDAKLGRAGTLESLALNLIINAG
jgi:hypothetical protein